MRQPCRSRTGGAGDPPAGGRVFRTFGGVPSINSCDDASLDELVAPDCEIVGPAGAGRGPAIYRQVFEMLRAAFPDVHVTIEEMLEAEGDRVIVRTRTSGTHRGVFMGIAPTEKS